MLILFRECLYYYTINTFICFEIIHPFTVSVSDYLDIPLKNELSCNTPEFSSLYTEPKLQGNGGNLGVKIKI